MHTETETANVEPSTPSNAGEAWARLGSLPWALRFVEKVYRLDATSLARVVVALYGPARPDRRRVMDCRKLGTSVLRWEATLAGMAHLMGQANPGIETVPGDFLSLVEEATRPANEWLASRARTHAPRGPATLAAVQADRSKAARVEARRKANRAAKAARRKARAH